MYVSTEDRDVTETVTVRVRSVTQCLCVTVIATTRTCIDRTSMRSEWKSRAGLSVLVQEMTLCDPTAMCSLSLGHGFGSLG